MPAAARRNPGDLQKFERSLLSGSRSPRTDLASRYVLPLVEDFATEKLMESRVAPMWLLYASARADHRRRIRVHARLALGGSGDAAVCRRRSTSSPAAWACFGCGRSPPNSYAQLLLWPAGGPGAAGAGLVGNAPRQRLGRVRLRDRGGRVCGRPISSSARHTNIALPPWLVLAPQRDVSAGFCSQSAGAWTGFLIAVLVYAAISFFFVQYLVHRTRSELTPH